MDDLRSMKPGTNSWWGRAGEILYLHLHPTASDVVSEYGNRAPFDAQHPEHGRVNVKTAGQHMTPHGLPAWKFQIDGVTKSCDHAFFIGLDTDREHVTCAWLMPVSKLPARLKVMSPASKEYVTGCEVPDGEVVLLDRKLQALLSMQEAPPVEAAPRVDYDRMVLGRIGEAIYRRLHPDSHHESALDPTATFDFIDPDGTKVNVRVRRSASRESGPDRWTFFRTQGCTADTYYFIGVDRSAGVVQAVYRVPAGDMPPTGFSVSVKGSPKWSKYQVSLDLPAAVSSFVGVTDLEAIHVEIAGLTEEQVSRLNDSEREALVRRAMAYHRVLGFPYPVIPSDKHLQNDLTRLGECRVEGQVCPPDPVGLGLCSAYMPHRFRTRNADADFSALGAFGDDDRFLKALRFCLKGKKPGLTGGSVRSALTALNRTPACFRPAVARMLVDEWCPAGGMVFDPCAGWGGRMVGAISSGRRYLGVESSVETHACLYRLGMRVCETANLDRGVVRLIHGEVQGVDLSGVAADFALTSPPFWTKEVYGVGGRDVASVEGWRESFLRPMFCRVASVLRPGGHFAVHMADVREAGVVIPLEQITVDDGTQSGFVLETTWRMQKGSFGNQTMGRSDPILVFRKAR